MAAADLQEFLLGDGQLHSALHRYTQTTMAQMAQNVVCNSTHPVEQRAARWLLTTADRVREAYPGPTWDRLVEVKRRYDPGNLFRRNQNIPPDPRPA